MEKRIALGSKTASDGGYKTDLPLDRDIDGFVVDARDLGRCHPMFAVRLRLFIDWHLAAGHLVRIEAPRDPTVAQELADYDVAAGVDQGVLTLPEPSPGRDVERLPVRPLRTYSDVELAANDAVALLHHQTASLACWGNAMHMAIGELCDNALLHGKNDLGAYLAVDRLTEPVRVLRLTIVDLGIGIPEHIRSRHPEWQDDAAAIARAIERGVSGTGDPYRGNGFSEVFREALETDLVQARSAADIEIRSSRGMVGVTIAGGTKSVRHSSVRHPRRGTWITYTITTA